jgi:hypothetical protein
MASKNKKETVDNVSKKKRGSRPAVPRPDIKPRQKVYKLAELIYKLTDSEGYFDPKDVNAEVRGTDLYKSASIIISNLGLQGFGKDDRLRVPVFQGPETVKKFINLAARLRRQKGNLSFEDAVDVVRSEMGLPASIPEPPSAPVAPKPVAKKTLKDVPASQKPGTDFRALYEESKEKVFKLEGELAAYKEICLRLLAGLKE